MNKKQLILNNRLLSYLDVGEGPVVLFGHSYLWDAGMWCKQVGELSKKFRCIVPELWGHGDSDPVNGTGPYSMESLTEDMMTFVQALNLDSFSLVGLSVGGMWTARLAHRCPDLVSKLVLMDTDLGSEPPESRARFLGMIDMAESAGAFPPPLVDAVLPFFFCDATLERKDPCVERFGQSLLQWPEQNLSGTLALGRGIFTRENFLPQLKEISCPSLVISGEQDRSRPPAEARVLAEHLPHSALVLIPDAGHIPTVEQPEQVTRVLGSFLLDDG